MGLRQDRVADQIRDALARMFAADIVSDPRLDGVTLTAVKVTADLQLASVYYRLLDDSDEKKAEVKKGFGSCRGFLRNKLSGLLELRRVPELRFFFDESIERGSRIEKLLEDDTD